MDKRKEANLRVKISITEALLHLLDQKSISEITVSEIISTAGVARSSFYRNYTSKENVITTLIADILEEYRENMSSDGENVYTRENIRMGFQFFSHYERIILDLHRFGYGSIILAMMNRFHEDIAGNMPHTSIQKYELYIYIGALYNTALMWLVSGKKESVDEITEMFRTSLLFTQREPQNCGKEFPDKKP